MSTIVVVEGGTQAWVTVHKPAISVVHSEKSTSVIGARQGIQGIQGERGFLSINETITDLNTPVLVASYVLDAKTYQNKEALIGCANPASIVTLDIKKQDGTVLSTLTKTGLLSWSLLPDFSLLVATEVFIIMTANDTAFIKGLSL